MTRMTIRNSDGSVSQPMMLDWNAALRKLAEYEDRDEALMNMRLKVKLDEGAKMPTRAHAADAGLDLYAPMNMKNQTLVPRSNVVIDTGVHIAIPEGFVGMLKSKSGLNVKHDMVNEGVIDAGYTGSIAVKVYNLGTNVQCIHPGDKISQLVILPCLTLGLELVDHLEETERGAGGFGSTGLR
ncbi:MAG: dUTP diphosphatase [Clostridia bacterium]|nr:dUTP diphosphatase [Clostridia bacterium]